MSHPSLCFLSYQRPLFIRTAIETALATAGEPVEVLVHDDGSTDPAVREYLIEQLDRGRISHLMLNPPGHNEGQGVALNRMFRAATGDPIIKLDQDLIFLPGWVQGMRRILQDPRVGLLGFFKYEYEPVDWRRTIITDVSLMEAHKIRQDELPRGHSYHTHICGSGFAIPRTVWEMLGPFAERYESFGEDWDMQKRVHNQSLFFNALPDDDLVRNQGFGIGPSTVVVAGEGGQPTVQKIKPTAYIVEEA